MDRGMKSFLVNEKRVDGREREEFTGFHFWTNFEVSFSLYSLSLSLSLSYPSSSSKESFSLIMLDHRHVDWEFGFL